MKDQESPEPLLLAILSMDGSRIREFADRWIREYVTAGEYGLAYEGVIAELEDGNYVPSEQAWALIVCLSMILEYPYPRRKE